MQDILSKLVAQDADSVNEGQLQLRRALNNQNGFFELCSIIHSSPKPVIRHTASVVLRKAVSQQWQSLPPSTQIQIKRCIMNSFSREPEKYIKRPLSQICGTVVQIDDLTSWPELSSFLLWHLNSTEDNDRNLGLFLLLELTSSSAPKFIGYFHTLINNIFNLGSERELRSAGTHLTIQCLDNYINGLSSLPESELQDLSNGFVKVFSKILSCAKAMSKRQLVERAVDSIICLGHILSSSRTSCAIGAAEVSSCIKFACGIVSNHRSELDLKVQCLKLFNIIVQARTEIVTETELLKDILQSVFLSQADDSDTYLEEYLLNGSNEETSFEYAVDLFEIVSQNIDQHLIVPLIISLVNTTKHGRSEPAFRAMFVLLGSIAPSLSRLTLLPNKELIDLVLEGIGSKTPFVKNAAFFAMNRFITYNLSGVDNINAEIADILASSLQELQTEGRSILMEDLEQLYLD